jgi:hypothetical protein
MVTSSPQPPHSPPMPMFSAPQVARATSPLAEQAFVTTRTLIDRQANQTVVAPQLVSELSERDPAVRLAVAVAESERLLPAARRAETAAAVWLELDAAHRASRQGLAIVTRIVTHGVRAHAATACARSAARASCRSSWPSWNWWPASSSRSWLGALMPRQFRLSRTTNLKTR